MSGSEGDEHDENTAPAQARRGRKTSDILEQHFANPRNQKDKRYDWDCKYCAEPCPQLRPDGARQHLLS